MKKLLNTLYVQSQGSYLRQEGETVVIEREHEIVAKIPIHTLSSIVCFGNVLCSPFLLGLCGERGVHVKTNEIRQQLIDARDEYIGRIRAELMGPGSEFSVPDGAHELISSSPLS